MVPLAMFSKWPEKNCESKMRKLWPSVLGKREVPPFASAAGQQQGSFSRHNSGVCIGWSVCPGSPQPGRTQGPATVINALPCRHAGGCLLAVSSFPVLLPDISLMWLDNEEIDSDHYVALKEWCRFPACSSQLLIQLLLWVAYKQQWYIWLST